MPVADLLGTRRPSIPAYAMVGWYYDGGMKEFIRQCTDAVSYTHLDVYKRQAWLRVSFIFLKM